MATRKISNSKPPPQYVKLVRFLTGALPKTEDEALTKMAKACTLAETCGFEQHYRREGESFPPGFSTYPAQDKHSIGAFFCRGKKLWGWRWSLLNHSASYWCT
jgi:hypothetical protein